LVEICLDQVETDQVQVRQSQSHVELGRARVGQVTSN